MSAPRSFAALALALAVFLSGCDALTGTLEKWWKERSGKPSAQAAVVENYAGVPYTLAELRAQAAADGSRFEQHARDDRSGSPCHGEVCLLIAPFFIAKQLFPERWIEATVTGSGAAPRYHGTFQLDGTLIALKVEQNAIVREVALLDLRALARKVVVEVARRPAEAPDEAASWQRTPLASQVDLAPVYSAAAQQAKSESAKRKLLLEALRVLDAESVPLLREQLKPGAPVRDAALADLIGFACWPGNGPVSVEATNTLFALAAQGCSFYIAHLALQCARARSIVLPAEQASALATMLAAGYCAGDFRSLLFEDYDWMAELIADYPSATIGATALATCKDPVRLAGVRFMFDMPATRAELEPLFMSNGADAMHTLEFVGCPWPGGEQKPPSSDDAFACVSARTTASAAVTARAREYVDAVSARDVNRAAELLRSFERISADHVHQLPNDLAPLRPARTLLERAAATAAANAGPAFALAQFCLGDRRHADAAQRARAAQNTFAAELVASYPGCASAR